MEGPHSLEAVRATGMKVDCWFPLDNSAINEVYLCSNRIFIVNVDTLTFTYLGSYGNEKQVMDKLERWGNCQYSSDWVMSADMGDHELRDEERELLSLPCVAWPDFVATYCNGTP
eukprot:TRINITY_DN65072_c0_g2_i1.p1 TRINITY_DN65072_c0_g2~~TRINITY_DN65072_c0_g2_i1.p1  ORF type:complete len:115 (-),score=3.21 TRINITY_DN65072_c0_g2_i1:73-417(-)